MTTGRTTPGSTVDDCLRPLVREAIAGMIDDLPAMRDGPPPGHLAVASRRPPARPVRSVLVAAAVVAALIGGLAMIASRGARDQAAPTASMPGTEVPGDGTPTRWEDGVRMAVYMTAGARPQSLDLVRERLTSMEGVVAPDGIRYLDPQASLAEARRLLADDPLTLELLTEENIPTAFYVTTVEGVTYDELLAAADVVEQLPEVREVVVDDADAPVIPGLPTGEGTTAPVGVDVTSSVPRVGDGVDDLVVDEPLAGGAWSGARTTADGRSLLLFVTGATEYAADDPCSMDYAATADESDADVTVSVRGVRPGLQVPIACRSIGYLRAITVELAEPMGDRTLVALGAAREVFDGATLSTPGWIPEDWVAGVEMAVDLGDDRPLAWSRSWAPPHPVPRDGACVPDQSGVTLFEGDVVLVDALPREPDEVVVDTFEVGDATATLSTEQTLGINRLTWVAGDRGYVLVSFPSCAGDIPASPETLLAFARGLQH